MEYDKHILKQSWGIDSLSLFFKWYCCVLLTYRFSKGHLSIVAKVENVWAFILFGTADFSIFIISALLRFLVSSAFYNDCEVNILSNFKYSADVGNWFYSTEIVVTKL